MEGRLKRPTSVAVIMAPRQHVASYSEWSYVFKIRSSLSSSTLATGNFGSSPLTLFFFLVSADSGAASVLLVLCQISGDAKRERINRLCPSKGSMIYSKICPFYRSSLGRHFSNPSSLTPCPWSLN